MLQGWDVLLQRLHDFRAALSSAVAPPSTAVQPQQQTPPFGSFILSHPLDAQSGLLIVEVVATSHRGKASLPHAKTEQATTSQTGRCVAEHAVCTSTASGPFNKGMINKWGFVQVLAQLVHMRLRACHCARAAAAMRPDRPLRALPCSRASCS